MKKATKSQKKRIATQSAISITVNDIIEKAERKISSVVNKELVKLEKKLRKQIKKELKGEK